MFKKAKPIIIFSIILVLFIGSIVYINYDSSYKKDSDSYYNSSKYNYSSSSYDYTSSKYDYSNYTSSKSSYFTNKYGTSTTVCAHIGCTNYIASSGDTNCCSIHSNSCLKCHCYIDEDASYCMDCIKDAVY